MERPIFRIKRDRNKWGVQAKWPRSGDMWAKRQFWPRWVWHGPLGITSHRWDDGNKALWFANLCQEGVDRKTP